MVLTFDNITNNLEQVSVWGLTFTDFDTNDLLWVDGLGAAVAIDVERKTVDLANGQQYTFAGRKNVYITTKTDKQVTMLKLKYGDEMWLHSTLVVAPNSTMELRV